MTQAKAAGQSLDDFMFQLKHPLKPEMQTVIALIRGADPAIGEGIKWNAPSFCVNEYFATVNVKAKDCVQIILHLGAKVWRDISVRVAIDDPAGLLEWLGNDRATVKFHDIKEIDSKGCAFQQVLRQWIQYLK